MVVPSILRPCAALSAVALVALLLAEVRAEAAAPGASACTLGCRGPADQVDTPDSSLLQLARDRDASAKEANPPSFGENVFVVEPGQGESYKDQWNDMYLRWRGWDDNAHFGEHRTAVLLKPGTHNLDINVPYYFSVVGLGARPTDTMVQPGSGGIGLRVDTQGNPNSCNTFWRSIENLEMGYSPVQFWVSQAAPMRSVKVDGDLEMAGSAWGQWASGGALMNSHITGSISVGNQQQWYTRGTTMSRYPRRAGPGSYVCVGCIDVNTSRPFPDSYDLSNLQPAQYGHIGESYTAAPEIFAEKPYIVAQENGTFGLQIPALLQSHVGPSFATGQLVPFERVFVASPQSPASKINSKIAAGKHIVFTPGIYRLSAPIVVNRPDIVLLGLGYATLIPYFDGDALVKVGDVDGVRIAGLLLQAGRYSEANPVMALLQWGARGSSYEGSSRNPGFIYDLVARVGGPEQYNVGVESMVEINNGWVIGDNLWLWSADHCVGGVWPCPFPRVHHALVVNAANVRMYGLMAEHTDQDIVVWNGENGETHFYQSEFRYAMGPKSKPPVVPGPSVSYRVNARHHKAIGFGIYDVIYQNHTDQWPLQTPGGFSAISVKYKETYELGFKDANAANWGGTSWPVDSRLVCKTNDSTDSVCIDDELIRPWLPRGRRVLLG